MPTRAAYAFARTGDLKSAVEVLESARARLVADSIERGRADLERLPSLGHADLYERYRSASERIAQLESIELGRKGLPANLDISAEQRTARARLDEVVADIQRITGYEGFFRQLTFDSIERTLTEPLVEGGRPVVGVYLAVTSVGGMVLIVHSGGVEPVWLDFTDDDLNSLLIKQEGEGIISGYLPGQLGGVPPLKALDEALPAISENLIQPIAGALERILRSSRVSVDPNTVILIPTGLLSLLPLHAAQYEDGGSKRTLLDEYKVAYVPSARALARSREAIAISSKRIPTLFGIGNPLPLPPGVPSLLFARTEVEEIGHLFGDRAEVTFGTDATRSAVERGLTRTSYLHFACHGQFNSQRPLESGLVLSAGEQLTLGDLLAGCQRSS
jgi:hypothetical protein